MTDEQARKVFNEAIAVTPDPEQVAKLELARDYFTNPAFRKAMSELIWQINLGRRER